MIYIKKLRVRNKKSQPTTLTEIKYPNDQKSTAAPYNMCGVQLAAMLGCWAASSDYQCQSACKEAAETLFHCMRTTPMPKKSPKPTINYHLARLSKKIQ
ncbi:hypothetical protein B0H10DRAFT_1786383 [Mycena sp. CBHHK59/15]|nr:hypothetical protein B0H10DRAFT_1786383 [Mycena sp. CBHHK59/15]